MGFKAPPLGNTVSYSIWAHSNQFGMYLIDRSQARPGDLLLWSKTGKMSQSGGANGHGMIVESIDSDGSFNTMESRSRVGVCFYNRERGWPTEVVRIVGMTPADVEEMRQLTRDCIRQGIPYYAGLGDNDHDGLTDRADLNDGNGVDCTGYNWDCWKFAETHEIPVPPPKPQPIYAQEIPPMFMFNGEPHRFTPDKNGDLWHQWGFKPAENLSAQMRKKHQGYNTKVDVTRPIEFIMDPMHNGVIYGQTTNPDGWLLSWVFLGGWDVAAYQLG